MVSRNSNTFLLWRYDDLSMALNDMYIILKILAKIVCKK
jgi:hypothetical protein